MDSAIKKLLKSLKMNESQISQALGALVVVVIGVLLFNYFQTTKGEPEITETAEQTTVATSNEVELTTNEEGKYIPKGLPTTHTVEKGDHLWSISEKYYGNGYNWVDIASENGLSNAGIIEVGMELTIPEASLRYDKDVAMMEEVKEEAQMAGSLIDQTSYTVVKGDHLWDIAVRAYADGYKWADIYNANTDVIADPNVIEVGMVLSLPR